MATLMSHNSRKYPNTARRRNAASTRDTLSADLDNEQSLPLLTPRLAPPVSKGRHGPTSNIVNQMESRAKRYIVDVIVEHRFLHFILVMFCIGTLFLFTHLLLLPAIWGQNATSANSSTTLEFGPVTFAGYNNWVYRDNITAAQVLLSEASSATKPSRFITAFANGNTGALVYFTPSGDNSTSLGTSLEEGSLTSYQAEYNQTGLQGNIVISSNLTFGVTLIGSV